MDYNTAITNARSMMYTGYFKTDPNMFGIFHKLHFLNGELHNPGPLQPALVAWEGKQLWCVSFYEYGKAINASSTLPHHIAYFKGYRVDSCWFVDDNGEFHDPAPGIPAVYGWVIKDHAHYNHGKFV